MTDFTYPLNTRVELKPDCEEFYHPFAIAGAQGTIRRRKYDDDGFPLVYISWDEDHWRYTGTTDMWTFESHFRPVELPYEDDEEEEEVEDDEDAVCPHCGGLERNHDEQIGHYIDHLMEAVDTTSEGEAFLILSINAVPNVTGYQIHPQVYVHSMNEEATAALEWQLLQLARAIQSSPKGFESLGGDDEFGHWEHG